MNTQKKITGTPRIGPCYPKQPKVYTGNKKLVVNQDGTVTDGTEGAQQ